MIQLRKTSLPGSETLKFLEQEMSMFTQFESYRCTLQYKLSELYPFISVLELVWLFWKSSY